MIPVTGRLSVGSASTPYAAGDLSGRDAGLLSGRPISTKRISSLSGLAEATETPSGDITLLPPT